MRDILFVLVTIGFFALATAYILACARIVGGDQLVRRPAEDPERDRSYVCRGPCR